MPRCAPPFHILVVLLVALLCIFPTASQGCGVTTHNVIAHRALQWLGDNYPALSPYAELLRDSNNQHAFQNGASFPDWGYACPLAQFGYPKLPDMSEAAHWPPFQRAVVQHILKHYPREPSGVWTEQAQRLIAFLLGVVSHSVADITWHDIASSYATQQGFIQALAESDFYQRNSSYDGSQHTKADAGGEFMAAYELDLSFISDVWFLPADDLAKVYAALNFSVPPMVIQVCNGELYAEVMAIKHLGKVLYPEFASNAPFLVDHYQNYWLGGVNDMATWTTHCWPNVIEGLNTGEPIRFCFEDQSDVLQAHNALMAVRQLRREGLASALQPYARQIVYDQHNTPDGVVYSNPRVDGAVEIAPPSSKATAIINEKMKAHAQVGAEFCVPQTGPESGTSVTFTVPIGYSYTGKSLATGDFNGDGLQDFVVGAPGYTQLLSNRSQVGAAFLVYGSNSTLVRGHQTVDLTASSVANATFTGHDSNERFGQAVVALDFNLDGVLDLVVSSPGIGFGDLNYFGRVNVFLGKPGNAPFAANPDIIIASSRSWTNLGYTLASCDLNGDGHPDLVIGSPYARGDTPSANSWEIYTYQKGAVSAFVSSAQRLPASHLDWRGDADWFVEGEALYDWFGSAVACHAMPNNGSSGNATLLVVSAPGTASPAAHESGYGKAYGYLFTKAPFSSATISAERVFCLSGAHKLDHLGTAIALGNPYSSAKPSGYDTALYLAVSMPTKSVIYYGVWDMVQAGVVVLLDVRDLMARGNVTVAQLQPRTTLQSQQSYSHFGQYLTFGDLNGDGVEDLVVAAPHYDSSAGTDAGALFGYTSGATFPSGTAPSDSAALCIRSGKPYALYGMQAATLDFNGDGRPDLLLSGPRDTTGGGSTSTHAGAVSLILR